MSEKICRNCNEDGLHCHCCQFNPAPTPTDNKAPRVGWAVCNHYEFVWEYEGFTPEAGDVALVEKSAYDKLQSRLEKCEELLAESKGYLLGYTVVGHPLALEIEKYFAEVEGRV